MTQTFQERPFKTQQTEESRPKSFLLSTSWFVCIIGNVILNIGNPYEYESNSINILIDIEKFLAEVECENV